MLKDPLIRYPIAISFGAIAGALSRYYLTLWFAQRFGTSFPYGTFFINLTGCLAMGFFVTLVSDRLVKIPPEVVLMLTTGFLGAYTTFSTYGLDSLILLRVSLSRPESISYAISTVFYWAGSAILGIICVQLGVIIGRQLL